MAFDSDLFVTILTSETTQELKNELTHPGVAVADTSNVQDLPESEPQGLKTETDAARIQELEAQLKEKENKYIYLYADFENYKKRAVKERSDAMKFGWENVARELIDVCDNLERALTHIPAGTDKNLSDGLNMILSQFRGTMQKQGVQPIVSLSKLFDPEFHEAVGQEPAEEPQGIIIREVLKGYTLHGRLLRPSNVIISMGPLAK